MKSAPRLVALSLSLLIAGLPGVLPSSCLPVEAAVTASLVLNAAPDIVLADGKSSTMITASVRGTDGGPAPDGTLVQFTTSAGLLTQDTATTLAGVARIRLISTTDDEEADITATAFLASSGGATGNTVVEFTTDKEVADAGRGAQWIQIECPQYLVYSADRRIIEADGKDGSAHLRYRALSITADALQLDLTTQTLLARNAVLKQGRNTLTAARLRYDLANNTGTAVADDAGHADQTVDVSGLDFHLSPESTDEATYSTNVDIYQFADLYSSVIVIGARAISVKPGDSLQFRRATVFAGGRKALSMPYDVMPVNTMQPFGHQAIGFNTGGIALDIPFYYHVDPSSVGAIYVRNGVMATGDGSGPLDTIGDRPGFAIDLRHTYTMGLNGSGEFLLNGLTRSDWGAHWDDTQRFNDSTNGYFLVDSPDHRSLYGSSNLTKQFAGFSLSTIASGNRDPGRNGYSSSSTSLNTSLDTDPRLIGRSGVNVVSSLAWQLGQYAQTVPGAARTVTPVNTQTASLRFFTAPFHPNGSTDLTDALTVGESWGSGRTSPTMQLNLGMNKETAFNGKLSLNYTWSYDPLYSQLGAQPSGGLLGDFYSPSTQRLSLNFAMQPSSRMAFSLATGYGLPFHDSNVYSSFSYRISPDWGIGAGEYFDRYLGDTYRETQFSLTRRLFGRDFTVIYSTLTHKFMFDFMGTQF